ncbi:MAG: D-glycero-beta-D-manno-heptose-7-phosphate kinase, partial [Campylobacteraceae bacterium]|nr:D-glycero-beta-D-manno-heptose-7-phosphate kinase [Campylobacteraceae bacterium]
MYEMQKIPNILVVGDFMIDHYLWGSCNRISPEAPVQVVDIKNETSKLGGAGNVVLNLLSLGAKVDVSTVLGEDENSQQIVKMLEELKIDIDLIEYEKDRVASKKTRVIAAHQQIIRFDKESKDDISKETEEKIERKIVENIKKYDVILLSDYAKGILTDSLTQKIIKKANENNIFVLVDPKGNDYSKYFGATLLTPNKKEASIATNIDIKDDNTLLEAIKKLKNDVNLKYSLITLSEDGMAIYVDKLTKIPTIAREVYDVTGAGDTVLAALGVGLSLGYDIYKSASFATSAAAVVVAKLGSAVASIEEIVQYEKKANQNRLEEKIFICDNLKNLLSKTEKKIVFTNGC